MQCTCTIPGDTESLWPVEFRTPNGGVEQEVMDSFILSKIYSKGLLNASQCVRH